MTADRRPSKKQTDRKLTDTKASHIVALRHGTLRIDVLVMPPHRILPAESLPAATTTARKHQPVRVVHLDVPFEFIRAAVLLHI